MSSSIRPFTASILASTIALAVTAGADAQVVYSQPPLFGNGNSFPAEINGGQQADDWVANTSSTVQAIRWWGTSAGPNSAGFFTLRVFSNSGGLPGSLLNQISIGNSFTQVNTGNSDMNGRDIYMYEASLGSGFTPTMGVTYWLSIMNDNSATGGPSFLWHQGAGGNGSHAFRVGAGSWSSTDGDMAFQLIIPTPATMALLGLAGLMPRRRRHV